MIDVLEPGVKPPPPVYTERCSNCGCVFRFTPEDAFSHFSFDKGLIKAVMCPMDFCSRVIKVEL